MDRRDPPPYFIHGGFGVPPRCTTPFSLLNHSLPLPAQSPNSSEEGQSGDPRYQESPPLHWNAYGGGSSGGTVHGGAMPQQGEPLRKKRGRPRKYGPDGNVGSLPPISPTGEEPGCQKRGRGRPPGTGIRQQLALHGEWFSSSAGMGFIPHAIEISSGEDMAAKIMSFSQRGPRAICILSATGVISSVTLRRPDASGGTVTYEGHFEILCLSGSYFLADYSSSRSRAGGLSVTLSGSDGRVIGGVVGGQLIAASPVQVMVGSFIYGGNKARSMLKSKPEPEPDVPWDGERTSTGISLEDNATPPRLAWPASLELDEDGHIDINQTHN